MRTRTIKNSFGVKDTGDKNLNFQKNNSGII